MGRGSWDHKAKDVSLTATRMEGTGHLALLGAGVGAMEGNRNR